MEHCIEIVLPVWNEAHTLEASVRKLCTFLCRHSLDCHIRICDNGSTDETPQVGRKLERDFKNVAFIQVPIKGRGAALSHAWSNSKADFSLYMDIDLSTDLSGIRDAQAKFKEGADLVVGSRLHPDAVCNRSPLRSFLSKSYNNLAKAALGSQAFDDAQCGFKGIRVATVAEIVQRVKNKNWFFDTELLFLAERRGLDIRSIPVNWHEDIQSSVRIIPTIMEDLAGLARLMRIRFQPGR